MAPWKHFNHDQRKLISSMLSKKMKRVEIAQRLSVDPTSISKEIKRNRTILKKGQAQSKTCKLTSRFPYVCNSCVKKFQICTLTQYKYDSQLAQRDADIRLISSRLGLNMTSESYHHLDKTIKEGVSQGQSIYHIVKNNPSLSLGVSTLYRLINSHQLSTKRLDLPYGSL